MLNFLVHFCGVLTKSFMILEILNNQLRRNRNECSNNEDNKYENKPCGKESTKVRKSQKKGNKSENSYQKLKRSLYDRHTKTVYKYFDRHGCLYQSEKSKCKTSFFN